MLRAKNAKALKRLNRIIKYLFFCLLVYPTDSKEIKLLRLESQISIKRTLGEYLDVLIKNIYSNDANMISVKTRIHTCFELSRTLIKRRAYHICRI